MNCSKSDHCCFLALFLAVSVQGFTHPVSAQETAAEEPTTLEEAVGPVPTEAITVRVEETRAFLGQIQSELVFPKDTKSETLLRGRYLSQDERHQIIKPTDIIDALLQNIFRIKNVLEAVIAVVGSATFLAMILVFALSLRLRQREIQTIFKLGCRKGTIARLLGAEIGMILMASLALCAHCISWTPRSLALSRSN